MEQEMNNAESPFPINAERTYRPLLPCRRHRNGDLNPKSLIATPHILCHRLSIRYAAAFVGGSRHGGGVLALDTIVTNTQAKFIAVDKQADDEVMYLDGFGKADGVVCQTHDAHVQRQMLPFNCCVLR
jgi:hypothetical protein